MTKPDRDEAMAEFTQACLRAAGIGLVVVAIVGLVVLVAQYV